MIFAFSTLQGILMVVGFIGHQSHHKLKRRVILILAALLVHVVSSFVIESRPYQLLPGGSVMGPINAT